MLDKALAAELLDFAKAPGRHALRMRQPAVLFAQMDTLAQWALGRIPPQLAGNAEPLTQAAVMFVQRACFAPGNNHYQVLGLPPGTPETEQLRARYRALIRLAHPDMKVPGLPATAAGMVNRANAVLADSAQRKIYDADLETRHQPAWNAARPRTQQSAQCAKAVPLQRPIKRLIQHIAGAPQTGVGAHWDVLWAQYPTQARMLTAGTAAALVAVAILAWSADYEPGGAVLVAATSRENPVAQSAQKSEEITKDTSAARSGENRQALHTARNAVLIPATGGSLASPRTLEPHKPLGERSAAVPSSMAVSDQAPIAGLNTSRLQASKQEEAALTPVPSSPHFPPAKPATIGFAERQDTGRTQAGARAERMERLERLEQAESAEMRSAPPPDAGSLVQVAAAEAPAPAPLPSTVETDARANVTVAGSAPPPVQQRASDAPAAGNIDVPGSVQYLQELLQTLERPQAAQQAHSLLNWMNVKGNLLTPGIQLHSRFAHVKLGSLALSQAARDGTLQMNGAMVLMGNNAPREEATMLHYHVSATFVSQAGSTALARLNIVEAR